MTNRQAAYILNNTAWLGVDRDFRGVEKAVEIATDALAGTQIEKFVNFQIEELNKQVTDEDKKEIMIEFLLDTANRYKEIDHEDL